VKPAAVAAATIEQHHSQEKGGEKAMIQNAMFMQDVAPPVLPQSGRASAAAPGPANGGFASLLSGKQASQAQAAQGSDTPAGDAAAAQGAIAQPHDQAGAASPVAGGSTAQAGSCEVKETVAQAAQAAQAVKTADAGAAQNLVAQAEEQVQLTAVQPDGLLAGLAKNTRNPQPTEGRVQETDREEDGPHAVCTSLAADAQQIALAAQLALAILKPQDTMVTGTVGAATDCPPALEETAALPASPAQPNQAALAAPGLSGESANPQAVTAITRHGAALPAAAAVAVQAAAQPQEPMAASGPANAENQPLSGFSRPALQAYGPFAQARQSAAAPQGGQAQPSGSQAASITVQAGATPAQNAALDGLRAQAAAPEILQNADTLGAAAQNAAAGTQELGHPVTAAPVVPAAASADQQASVQTAPVQQGAAAQATESVTRQAPATAEGKAAHAAHGSDSALKGVAQQEAPSAQAATPDTAGTVAPAPQARSASFSGFSAGQNGSGSGEEKGNSEQKAQQSASTANPFPGVAPAPEANSSAASSEVKPTHTRDALHESILSQVRDGVVRHDGKGNGEMSLRLNPGELGELKIQVRMDDNRVRIEVQADNKMVKDLLMNNLDSLKESLTSRNFSMEGFDVSTGGGFNSPLNEQQGNPQQQQSRSRLAQSGGYAEGSEPARVNYLNDEGDNLLNVRF
jgi:flagellar hook-length control protein FliK